MIDFKTTGPDIKKACFGGSMDDLCAEMALMVSLIYGAINNDDKERGDEFKAKVMLTFIDPDISKKVFSQDVFNAISNNGKYMKISVNGEEFKRQLEAIMSEASKDDDDEDE